MAWATDSTPASLPDPLRLRRRLGLRGTAFGLLLLSVFSAALYGGIAAERRQSLRDEAAQLAASAASQLPLISHEMREVGNARKFRDDSEVVAPVERSSQRVQWFDPSDRLLQQQGGLAMPAASGPLGWQRWPEGISLRRAVHTRRRDGRAGPLQLAGYVRVGLASAPVEQELARLRRGLLLGGITAVIVALMVGRRLLTQAFRPLQAQVEALERFSGDVSHELRHPLTLLRTLVAAEPDPGRPVLRRIDAIAAGMTALLNDLLFLARQEAREAGAVRFDQADWRRFDLIELLEDQLAGCAPLAGQRAVELRLRLEPARSELPLRGQPEQLQRLVTNLLLNAIRFSPPRGLVELAVRCRGGRVLLSVSDQGPGIAPEHRQAIFERFWSLDARAGDHSGLGLPIARAIARRHGGELRLQAAEPGHCVLLVELPAG